ncbi:kinase-like domain-containing protein [Mycena crocata]|nr:kinase-like domain-containing protein [Mycena crocata]
MKDSTLDNNQRYSNLRYNHEQFWVDSQPFLLARGYQLRPRYRPGWVPSWIGGHKRNQKFEDSIANCVLDATRTHDGQKVILKRVENGSKEIDIIKHLDSARSDPRNRTIPVLDIFPMPDCPWTFLVMPYCRQFTYPPFHCRNEFLDAMTQFMEGLQFMHEQNIVHFDIAPQNMMMDESQVVPNGSHFSHSRTHDGFFGLFSWNDRCTVKPVDYYYIDFGLSSQYPNGKDTARCTGTLRTFPTIPELSLTVPYNPFKVDIFQFGLTMHNLIDAYAELEDFRPVADNMTAADPDERPTASDALAKLHGISEAMEPSKLSEQMWEKDTGLWKKATRLLLGGYRYDYLPPTDL